MAKWGMDFVNSVRNEKVPPPPFAVHLQLRQGMRFEEIQDGHVIQTWTVAPHFTLPDGIIQGGTLNVVADVSQTMALFTTLDAFETWATLDFHTRFVRLIRAADIVSVESKVMSKSKNSAVVETTFASADGKLLARVTGGWMKAERQRDTLPKAP